MQYGDFRDLVVAYAKQHGQPYMGLQSTGDINELLDERLKAFCAATLCLYSDAIAITIPTTGVYAATVTSVYDLRDEDIFAKPVYLPTGVIVDRVRLARISEYDARYGLDGYLFDGLGKPCYWMTMPPHHIRLIPASDDDYDDSYISGFYLQPQATNDGTEIEIPDEYVRSAAAWSAIALLEPDSTMDVYQRMNVIEARAGTLMRELEVYAKKMMNARRVRGRRPSGFTL